MYHFKASSGLASPTQSLTAPYIPATVPAADAKPAGSTRFCTAHTSYCRFLAPRFPGISCARTPSFHGSCRAARGRCLGNGMSPSICGLHLQRMHTAFGTAVMRLSSGYRVYQQRRCTSHSARGRSSAQSIRPRQDQSSAPGVRCHPNTSAFHDLGKASPIVRVNAAPRQDVRHQSQQGPEIRTHM